MTIFPNETVKLYGGIRIDPEYNNTLRWNNISQQNTFFHSTLTPIATLSNLSYQRVNKGVIRVQGAIGDFNTVNYMAFRNTDLNNKWFYAFVTKTEYVNNITVDIFYTLDYIQSYYFWCPFLTCYVEREHVADDTRGKHLLAEPININGLKPYGRLHKRFQEWRLIIFVTQKTAGGDFNITRTGGFQNAVKIYARNVDTASEIESLATWLPTITSDLEQVICMYLYPKNLVNLTAIGGDHWDDYSLQVLEQTIQFPNNVDGYTPRNNKVLTYPYCYLSVDNGDLANIYKYEFFNTAIQQTGGNMVFQIEGLPTASPTITCAPIAYKGSGVEQCYEERLQMQQLPQIAFPIDSFKAWLAQTQSTRQNKVISGALSSAGSMAMTGAALGSALPGIGTAAGAIGGALLGAISGGVGGMISNAYAESEAENLQNHVGGASQSNQAIAAYKYGYTFKYMGVQAEQAKVIDDFFTMFGYQVNELKTPDIHTRQRWNYIKTNGANFGGSVPAECMDVLKKVHDRGITYWQNHDDIGNYSLSNNPV